ncbi:hypothetical protein DSO57_1016762 [Entomophthora muscae]|uniref:Uncharacterized protein n=1 Tax=Entomophthora muscae TaxID=34485 RepID=A0ACC2SHT4_9FUNG|nr:hypothetical protein DSO57_1016762 [Entomophthora muscae]
MDYIVTFTSSKAHNDTNVHRFIGKEIISKFSKPELLIIDGDKELTSNNNNVYLIKQGVKHAVTTSNYPQANSRIEQFNEGLVQALAKISAGKPEDWHKQLATTLLVCRIQVNRSTGKSPSN